MGGQVYYFDNAATTYPKPDEVYNFADCFYRSCGGNIGRGGNALAVAAGDISRQAKDNMRTLYNCPSREVVFTSSATDALNRILLGFGLEEGDCVYISPFEHNAVTRPLHHLVTSSGIVVRVLQFDKKSLLPDMVSIERDFIERAPKLVVLTHASNVCGAVVPVYDICTVAKRYGAGTVVDMSQTAGLLDLNLESSVIDFAVFAGHKTLLAPFGIAGFFCHGNAHLRPVYFGGNGINSVQQDLPDNIVQMEEIGSQNTYAIAGLKASTDWLLSRGLSVVRLKEHDSCCQLIDLLIDSGIHIVGAQMECERIGVVSALFGDYSPDEVEMLLGRYGIAVRSGIQCAPYAHEFLGTLPMGTVRFSVSALTTDQDLCALQDALIVLQDV